MTLSVLGRTPQAVAAVAVAALLAAAGQAAAAPPTAEQRLAAKQQRVAAESQRLAAKTDVSPFRASSLTDTDDQAGAGHQHGGDDGHLPPEQVNVDLIGKLEPTKRFGDIVPGQIADLEVYKKHAYLNSWREPTCTRGGTYIADIGDPTKPEEAGFLPALPGNYHGEGAQILRLDTPAFEGDVLAVNNELCRDDVTRGGGFDLYDVSNPDKPRTLVQGFGDFGPEGSLKGDETLANQSHNIFMWQYRNKAYAVVVDNEELHDVDIFDITNPRRPRPVIEYDMVESFPEVLGDATLDGLILNHDDVVKNIDGRPVMLLSYWDAGYLKFDATNPAKLKYRGDTDFEETDPETGQSPPEGNAHQVEFSQDNRYLLAADEDFSPYRAGDFSITSGPHAGPFDSTSVSGGASPAALDDLRLNGPVVYGGYGCSASAPVPQRAEVDLTLDPGEEAILLLQRGPVDDPSAPEEACFPGEKAAVAAAAGWDAVLLVNRHLGSADADGAFCGSGGYPEGLEFVTSCTTHEAFHRMFGTEPNFATPVPAGDAPPIGTIGEEIEATAVFDGWGYAHLFRNENGKMSEIDTYATPESMDPDFAFGFGDLSIHEFAADPDQNLAYVSYYAAGARVLRFSDDGIQEVGSFIDEGGNNFWGVETFRLKGKRYFAESDRDFGLYLFRYNPTRDDSGEPPN
jgi:hypothetical protein